MERHEPLGIDYRVCDVMELRLDRRFDVATAIHLLHYLENAGEIASTLSRISAEGLETYGPDFFANYLANPQSKLVRLTRNA